MATSIPVKVAASLHHLATNLSSCCTWHLNSPSKLKLIGKNILVGITYLNESGDVEKQVELHGKIISVTKSCLIFKNPNHNDDFSIPFDEENFQPSPSDAIYRLKSTGEEIDNIDFLTTWNVYPSEKK